MTRCPRYLPPYPGGNRLSGLGELIHDQSGLGFRLAAPDPKGPVYPCRHSAIYAVSLYPGLDLVQFSNLEGLTLPVVIKPGSRPDFERMMADAYARQLGHLRGCGRFALPLTGTKPGRFVYCPPGRKTAVEGAFSSFVTYYLAPNFEGARFLQDGPSSVRSDTNSTSSAAGGHDPWRALVAERQAIRDWLADDRPKPPADGQAGDLFEFPDTESVPDSATVTASLEGEVPASLEPVATDAPWTRSA